MGEISWSASASALPPSSPSGSWQIRKPLRKLFEKYPWEKKTFTKLTDAARDAIEREFYEVFAVRIITRFAKLVFGVYACPNELQHA